MQTVPIPKSSKCQKPSTTYDDLLHRKCEQETQGSTGGAEAWLGEGCRREARAKEVVEYLETLDVAWRRCIIDYIRYLGCELAKLGSGERERRGV